MPEEGEGDFVEGLKGLDQGEDEDDDDKQPWRPWVEGGPFNLGMGVVNISV